MEALSAAHEAVAAHHGNNYLPLLEQYYQSHRSALFTLVDAIELEATSAERGVLDAVEFLRALRGAGRLVPERIDGGASRRGRDDGDATLAIDVDAFAGRCGARSLRDKHRPGMLVRRHLEVCVFSYLAAELRSGDIAVVGLGLLRQPARPADVLGGVRAAGRGLLRPGRDPADRRR